MGGTATIKLLLISDLHCIGSVWPAFNRITGDTRGSELALSVFDEVMGHYFDSVDYVLIVGDLTDSGKESQYRAVAGNLEKYDAEKISVIPGNHDVANFNFMRSWKSKMKMFKSHFRDYLNPHPEPTDSGTYFPYIRELNENFVLMGMDSTTSGTARGKLGDRQLERLDQFLENEKYSALHKIIMLHHDPIGKIKHYSGFDIPYGNVMEDADDFIEILGCRAEKTGGRDMTVVFGHTHNSAHALEDVEGISFIRVPSMGSIFGEDFLCLELSSDGKIVRSESELETSEGGIRVRKLKDMWKFLFPDKFE